MISVLFVRFIKAASLQGLVQEDTTTASLCKAMSEDTHTNLIIDCSSSPPTLSNAGQHHPLAFIPQSLFIYEDEYVIPLYCDSVVSNKFCDEWIQAFLNGAERFNPFLLRQILENFKLKVIALFVYLSNFVLKRTFSGHDKM